MSQHPPAGSFHGARRNKKSSFVPVNCGAVAEGLFERGVIDIKGKGQMKTYILTGHRHAEKK
jgi:hypothetical protein